MKTLLPCAMGLALLAACSDPIDTPTWLIRVTREDGTPLTNVPVIMSRDRNDFRYQTDANGEILQANTSNLDIWSHPSSVDGCPVQFAKRQTVTTQVQWHLIVPTDLFRACKDTFRLPVTGPALATIRWSTVKSTRIPDTPSVAWGVVRQDSSLLDSSGRGTLPFTGLLNPFADPPTLEFSWSLNSSPPRWWIDPADSVLRFLPPGK
ncbi:MAG: hypothetical protein RL318_316 [Fibrobacterota bacterium]